MTSARKQRGVAMLFIVLMLGLAVGTSTLLIWHAVRSTQEQQLTVHASTPAQASAWRGVEVLRRWLDQVDETAFEGWAAAGGVVPVAFSGADPGFSAGLTSVRKEGSAWRVEAAVTGLAAEGGSAQSRATVEVVYEIEPGAAGRGGSTPAAARCRHHIHATAPHRQHKVTGAENAGSKSTAMPRRQRVDHRHRHAARHRRHHHGSAIQVRNIPSKATWCCRAASGTQVRARGKATVSGGSNPVALRANGPVLFTGGAGDLVESKTGVTVTGGGVNITSVRSEGPVNWTGSGGGANRVHANGRVDYSGGNRSTTLRSRGAVALPAGEVDE